MERPRFKVNFDIEELSDSGSILHGGMLKAMDGEVLPHLNGRFYKDITQEILDRRRQLKEEKRA